jgi:hypothetical protein
MDRTEMMNYLAVIERTFYGQRSGITAAWAIAHIERLEAENAALKARGPVLSEDDAFALQNHIEYVESLGATQLVSILRNLLERKE